MPSRPASLIEAEPRVIVKRGRARPLFARHPWLFAGSIERVEGSPTDGADLAVYSHQGEFIARGLFNSHSQIQVRLYSWDESRPLDQAFWRERLVRAIELRRDVLQLADPAGARRLVYSESDGLSGLVVDQYGPWLVVQLTSLALARRLDLLVSLLVELCQPRGIYLRTERGIREAEGLDLTDRPLWGEVPTAAVAIVENGLEFEVDLVTGQKTGFYLDQRDNRRIVASYARGRRVLDVFCYTGGFSLAAARAGAVGVLGIDVSSAAIEMAERNAARNQLSNVCFQVGDAFESMHQLAGNGSQPDRFGMVILDPPKFARHARSAEDALRGYRRANLLALKLLEPNGILVTCSCSGHVSAEDFTAMLGAVAEQAGRPLQILAQLGQAPDHPISASCPETTYLKCFVTR
ncbi:MAG: class I SAM-dependent rRNA methyltransferase [Planctomycetes bacterium]|nr:class I SAM-dependent rRNA methyltransferase [Planctomycetota bacterium]